MNYTMTTKRTTTTDKAKAPAKPRKQKPAPEPVLELEELDEAVSIDDPPEEIVEIEEEVESEDIEGTGDEEPTEGDDAAGSITPKMLARKCGTDPRNFRKFLRAQKELERPGQGGRWEFTQEEADKLEAAYKAWQSSPRKTVSADGVAKKRKSKKGEATADVDVETLDEVIDLDLDGDFADVFGDEGPSDEEVLELSDDEPEAEVDEDEEYEEL